MAANDIGLVRSKMTLNYQMIMGRNPNSNPNGGVGGLIPDYESLSLLDRKTKSPPTTR